MRGVCSASPWACLLPRTMAPFIVQRRNCKRAAPARRSPLVVLARPSGQGLLALASPPSEVTHSQVYWLVLPVFVLGLVQSGPGGLRPRTLPASARTVSRLLLIGESDAAGAQGPSSP